jgi:hypothetical protein
LANSSRLAGDVIHHPPANNEKEKSHVNTNNHLKKDQHTTITVKGETK